jgi:hypothetical protein
MKRQQPRSVTNAVWFLVGLVVLSGLTALLTVLLRDELVRSWTLGHPDTGTVQPPQFIPVAIVLFFVFAALAGVLLMFLLDGHSWARVALTGFALFLAVTTLAGLRADPPPLFLVVSALAVVLEVGLLACLWHRDTGAYIRGAWLASHPESTDPGA